MGGCIEKGQLPNFSWELPLSQVKFELKSNVVPIGKIKAGIHIHRALLFKVWNCIYDSTSVQSHFMCYKIAPESLLYELKYFHQSLKCQNSHKIMH